MQRDHEVCEDYEVDLKGYDRLDRFRCFLANKATRSTRLFHSQGDQDEVMCSCFFLILCVCVFMHVRVRAIVPPRMRLKQCICQCVVAKSVSPL